MGISLRALNGILCNFLYFAVVYYTVLAGINFSVIISIFAFTPFITAVAFYVLFKENLDKAHFYGIAFLTLCIIIIS